METNKWILFLLISFVLVNFIYYLIFRKPQERFHYCEQCSNKMTEFLTEFGPGSVYGELYPKEYSAMPLIDRYHLIFCNDDKNNLFIQSQIGPSKGKWIKVFTANELKDRKLVENYETMK